MYILTTYLQALIQFYSFSVQLISYPFFIPVAFLLFFHSLFSSVSHRTWEMTQQLKVTMTQRAKQEAPTWPICTKYQLKIVWVAQDESNTSFGLAVFFFPSSDSPPCMMLIPIHVSIFLFTWTLNYLNVSSVWAVLLVLASLCSSNFCSHNTYVSNTAEIFNVFIRLNVRTADYFKDIREICLLISRN